MKVCRDRWAYLEGARATAPLTEQQKGYAVEKLVSIKGYVPRAMKRKAFSQLTLQEMTFSVWLQLQPDWWLRELGALECGPTLSATSSRTGISKKYAS
jgi:hypothetical protein